ncbi:ankyrin repeat-containing domain protein [Dactylonectria estremocensis]|uniref:Ankyrin repeat-containing domain protein n=1 Tax=Dactylonectria estremocensis TaxID=1079267 RepID=A0A9P9J6Y9_9HYPO|nr:ankyrin repeat-containing domain protein [Dactylonectria estremocensis]
MGAYILILLSLPLGAVADSSSDWSEFTNNFASDLAPIIALFGEQVTKQFLSESTSFLDNIIFGLAPLGILTAVVSVIRVYGNASLKAFIGRSQEPHAVAEAELCSSTSQDVCELWSNGGICRVFGRPKILEFFYTPGGEFYPKFSAQTVKEEMQPPSCGIELPRILLSAKSPTAKDTPPTGWIELQTFNALSATSQTTDDDLEGLLKPHPKFAPHPNLSLNIGIRTTPPVFLWSAAIFGGLLQLSLFGYATWTTFFAYNTEKATQLWSFCFTVGGTVLLVIGMILCAMLISRKSCSRRFTNRGQDSLDQKTVVFWLQPGDQRIGDQQFSAFAHSAEKQDYVTSRRVDTEAYKKDPDAIKYPFPTLIVAVVASTVGFICQFVGLRGVHGSVALYQLASTICMSIIRALLRSRRLGREKNALEDVQVSTDGHELDWQALNMELRHDADDPQHITTDIKNPTWYISDIPYAMKWPEHDESIDLNQEIQVLTITNSTMPHIVGFRPSRSTENDSDGPDDAYSRCSNEAMEWIRFNERKNLSLNEAAKILRIRSRLAYLTSDSITSPEQAWQSDVREMAGKLQEALQDTVEYIFSAENMLSDEWKQANALVWSTTCKLSQPTPKGGSPLPIHFLMYRDESGWKIDKHQLEASLGLWWWSLKQLEDVESLFVCKSILVEESQKSNFKSAIRLWITQTHGITESAVPDCSTQESDASNRTYPPTLSVVTSLRGSETPDTLEEEDSDMCPGAILSLKTKGSPLQKIAQDVFTIFVNRLADILEPLKGVEFRQRQAASLNLLGNSPESRYLGLMNFHVQSIADILVAAGIGSQEEALMSIVPPLLQRSKLPHLEDVMEDLLSRAKSLKQSNSFQQAEDLLQGLFHHGPIQFQEKVLRALGEIYRTAILSDKQLEQEFGRRGFRNMMDTYLGIQLSDKAQQTLENYKYVWEYFQGRGSRGHATRSFRTNDAEANTFLEKLMSQPARPRGLTLIDEFDFRTASPKDALPILRWAIMDNCPELVEDLLKVHVGLINEADDEGRTPLFWALGFQTETLQFLLDWPNLLLNIPDKKGMTALSLAAQEGLSSTVDLLLKRGADPRATDVSTRSPLHYAAESGVPRTVELLLNNGADVRTTDISNRTALHEAAKKGTPTTVELLLNRGADAQATDVDGKTPLYEAALHNHVKSLIILLKVDSDLNIPFDDPRYSDICSKAATSGCLETVRVLVREREAIPTMPYGENNYNGNVLGSAASIGLLDKLTFLIRECSVDVNMDIPTGYYGSALIAAAAQHNMKSVRFLVEECGADVNMVARNGFYGSALVGAAAETNTKASIEIVKFLVQECGADVNLPLRAGSYGSALAAATVWGYSEIVRFLIKEGADANMAFEVGQYGSALGAATTIKDQEKGIGMVKLLVQEYGADVNMSLPSGEYGSALATAAARGCMNVTRFLVKERGADVNMPLQNGLYGSAIAAAAASGKLESVRFLAQECGADVHSTVLSGSYGSVLAASSAEGKTAVVRFLVNDCGVDVNLHLQVGTYGSALAAAAAEGRTDVVEFLVHECDTNVNMQLTAGNYGSALTAAAYWGKEEVVKVLVEAGAKVDMELKYGWFKSALQASQKPVFEEYFTRLYSTPKDTMEERKASVGSYLERCLPNP